MAEAPPADLRTGREIAGYRIERLLGRGGMSVVYLAEQVRLRRPAALKLLAPELADDQRFRERFLRESQLAASLDHPNVIPIYDAGETDGVLYIAMRYVEGSDLRGLLPDEGRLEPQRALQLLRPVAEALDYAHAHGLVHRDVKPGNILLARDGPVYLSDFGLTRRVEEGASLTEAGELVGSLDYASPEQIDGRSVDGRADVYSLACVTYECLTGAAPFPRDSPMAKLWAHLRDTPLPIDAANPELPETLDPVLQRGLAKNPDERYSTASELTNALAAAIASPVSAPAGRRSRRTLLIGTLAGLAAIAGLTVALVLALGSGSTTPDPILPLTRDSVVHVDAASGDVTGAVPVQDPGAIAAGFGSVWVIDRAANNVVQIDPETGRGSALRLPEPLPESDWPPGIAAGEGGIWLFYGWLWRVDPETSEIVKLDPRVGVWDVAAGGGAVWASDWETLVKVLPRAVEVAKTIGSPEGRYARNVVIGGAGLWILLASSNDVSPSTHNELWRVDPSSGATLARLDLSFLPASFAVDATSLWVVDPSADQVVELDPETGEVRSTVRVGRIPGDIAVSGGAVWVANTRDGTVSRIDAETLDVTTVRVGGRPGALAATPDGVWVSVAAG